MFSGRSSAESSLGGTLHLKSSSQIRYDHGDEDHEDDDDDDEDGDPEDNDDDQEDGDHEDDDLPALSLRQQHSGEKGEWNDYHHG